MVVAVQKIKPMGFQGHNEWPTEVRYLGQLHHPNLVKLIGFCSDGANRLLVYEFMPRGSLENHLFRMTIRKRKQRSGSRRGIYDYRNSFRGQAERELKVEVHNISPTASKEDLITFSSYCGTIDEIQLQWDGDRSQLAVVTFKQSCAFQTAPLVGLIR